MHPTSWLKYYVPSRRFLWKQYPEPVCKPYNSYSPFPFSFCFGGARLESASLLLAHGLSPFGKNPAEYCFRASSVRGTLLAPQCSSSNPLRSFSLTGFRPMAKIRQNTAFVQARRSFLPDFFRTAHCLRGHYNINKTSCLHGNSQRSVKDGTDDTAGQDGLYRACFLFLEENQKY